MTWCPAKRVLVASLVMSLTALAGCTPETEPPAGNSSIDPSSLYEVPTSSATENSEEARPSNDVPLLDESIPISGDTGGVVATVWELLSARTPEEQLVLDTAEYLVTKNCMEKQGFTYLEPAPELKPSPPKYQFADETVGLVNAEHAARFGYQYNPAHYIEEVDKPRESSSTEYAYALMVGDDGVGCWTHGGRAIERDLPPGELPGGAREEEAYDVAGDIRKRSQKAALADNDYKRALAEWGACMQESGFDYADPWKPFEALNGLDGSADNPDDVPAPTPEQLKTAAADIECKQSSRLTVIYQRLLWDNQSALMEKNRPALVILEELDDQRLRTAQDIIEELG